MADLKTAHQIESERLANKRRKLPVMRSPMEHAKDIEAEGIQCCCNLDNWQPEKDTGHSWVCRIHKMARKRAVAEIDQRFTHQTGDQ